MTTFPNESLIYNMVSVKLIFFIQIVWTPCQNLEINPALHTKASFFFKIVYVALYQAMRELTFQNKRIIGKKQCGIVVLFISPHKYNNILSPKCLDADGIYTGRQKYPMNTFLNTLGETLFKYIDAISHIWIPKVSTCIQWVFKCVQSVTKKVFKRCLFGSYF